MSVCMRARARTRVDFCVCARERVCMCVCASVLLSGRASVCLSEWGGGACASICLMLSPIPWAPPARVHRARHVAASECASITCPCINSTHTKQQHGTLDQQRHGFRHGFRHGPERAHAGACQTTCRHLRSSRPQTRSVPSPDALTMQSETTCSASTRDECPRSVDKGSQLLLAASPTATTSVSKPPAIQHAVPVMRPSATRSAR